MVRQQHSARQLAFLLDLERVQRVIFEAIRREFLPATEHHVHVRSLFQHVHKDKKHRVVKFVSQTNRKLAFFIDREFARPAPAVPG